MPDAEAFQTGYVLPLYFSLAKAEKVNQTMVEELWKCIQADGGHLKTGFTATPYLLFALADHGYVKRGIQTFTGGHQSVMAISDPKRCHNDMGAVGHYYRIR